MQKMFAPTLRFFRRVGWQQLRNLLLYTFRRMGDERLDQVIGSLTFTSVLALVPFLTIALAIFTTFPIFHTFRASLETYFIQSLIPKAIANTILGNLTMFASKASRLSSVGAIALMVTAFSTMAMIDGAFNHIWRVKKKRPLLQRILVYWGIVTLGPLLIGVSFSVTSHVFMATSDVVGGLPFLGDLFFSLLSILLTAAAFTLLYTAVPNRFVDWRDAAWGALVAGIAFEIAKRLFAIFVAKFSSYTMIYGALAAIPLFLLWIYVSWAIILVCALLVAALPVVKYERWWHQPKPGGVYVDAMAILEVLFHARIDGETAAVNTASLRLETQLGYDEMDMLLEKMLDAGWVARIKIAAPKRVQWGKRITDGADCWVLVANPRQLTLADVYRLFVFETSGDTALGKKVELAVEQGLNETISAQFGKV